MKYALSLMIILFLSSCKDKQETYTVKPQILYEAVYASGEIFPAQYQYLQNAVSERVSKILVKAGDVVKAGTPLVILGSDNETQRLRIADQQLALARKNASENETVLTELKTKTETAKTIWEQDEAHAIQYEQLAKTKAVSQLEADNARTKAIRSKNDYESLVQQYQTRRRELQNSVLLSENERLHILQSYDNKTLTSKIDGVVYGIHVKENEMLDPNASILLVGSPGKFILELLIDERDIQKVKTGQEIYFETEAFAGKQFAARITKINPVLQKETRSFRVDAAVEDTETVFYPQSSVEANIIIRQDSNAVLIPQEYLMAGDSVLVQTKEKPQAKKVTTGLKAPNGMVEITAGVTFENVLIKPKK